MNNIKPVSPNSDSLDSILTNESKITICSPFYTAGGLMLFEELLSQNNSINEINFNCRLNKQDWINGVIDPEYLLGIIEKYRKKIKFNVSCADNLHAKIYYGEQRGLIGSANLTSKGFGNSLEFLLLLSGNTLIPVQKWHKKKIVPFLKLISLQELKTFVQTNKKEVSKKRKAIIRILKKRQPNVLLSFPSIYDFIDFCAKRNDEVAKEVVLRFMGKEQLSGHIINFYYASQQFLNCNKALIKEITATPPGSFRLQKAPFKNDWINFIKSQKLKDIRIVKYSRRSTFNYLPKSLGGKQTSGGAGVGNLNRVLPLVAQFMRVEGSPIKRPFQ